MARILLCGSSVKVRDSQAYRKMDVAREHISRCHAVEAKTFKANALGANPFAAISFGAVSFRANGAEAISFRANTFEANCDH